VFNYRAAVYTDSDVLILRNPTGIIASSKFLPNRLYVKEDRLPEKGMSSGHLSKYFRVAPYSEQQLARFKKLKIKHFNSGVLMFRTSKRMLKHFSSVIDLLKSSPQGAEWWSDQPYLNTYFNLHELSDTTLLQHRVSLYHQSSTLTRAVFAHFIWGAPTKLRAMQAYQTLWVKNEDCHLLPREGLDPQ
jgi:hypothetical protein